MILEWQFEIYLWSKIEQSQPHPDKVGKIKKN